VIWNSKTTVHSFAMDKQGRVWAALSHPQGVKRRHGAAKVRIIHRQAASDQSERQRGLHHVGPEDEEGSHD
jgi:hypothetical protein